MKSFFTFKFIANLSINTKIITILKQKRCNLNDPINLYLPIFSNLTVLENNYSSIKDINKADTLRYLKAIGHEQTLKKQFKSTQMKERI